LSKHSHILMDIGKHIKALRESAKLTQPQLAKKVGLTYIQIGRYERGISMPSSDALKKLASVLGTTSDFLMNGADDENVKTQISDKELLSQFRDVQKLPVEDKAVIKSLIDAFLLKKQVQKLTGK
jgi:transcriptional regulator with XRE-family HTH domain